MKRGGRRYYRPEDLQLLSNIKALLYEEGYTIKGAQRHLREVRGSKAGGDADQAGGKAAATSEESAQHPASTPAKGLDTLLDDLQEMREILKRALN